MSKKAVDAADSIVREWYPSKKGRYGEGLKDMIATALDEYARAVAVEAFVEGANVVGGEQSDEYYRRCGEEWWNARF